jgi:signal transduction histidine kinase
MVFISQTFERQKIGASGPEDVNFASSIQIIRCYPLRSAVLQLIPVYLLSLVGVVVTFLLVRHCYGKSIRDTLNRGEGLDTQIRPGSHGWKQLEQLEVQYEETARRLRAQTPELLRMENALRYAGDAEENRRKLISDMTHELKTPLAVIHSYAEGLMEWIAPVKQENYLRIIMEEAEKMDSMVLSMLDLSRLEAGRVHLNREPVCLMDMAKTVFEKLKPMYEKKNLRVHFLGETFEILADRGRMEQMITNMATNAIKYCTPAGDVFVKVHHLGNQIWFSMENDCYRLPQKALDQIWDSFFREDSVRATKGTGLGLPIVKAIVELHGGNCRAVNTDSGVEFQIMLPA